EKEQRRGRHVEVGPQLAAFHALPEEVADAFLVTAALGHEALAPLSLESAPLAREDSRCVELLADDTQVRVQRKADLLRRRQPLRDGVQSRAERRGARAGDLPEEVLRRGYGVVERGLLDPERLGEVGQ